MKRVISLMSVATMFAACDSGPTAPPDVTNVSMANPKQFVADSVIVPTDRMMYGIDLNGDGKADNALGNIIGALISAGSSGGGMPLKVQEGVDTAVCEGQVVFLTKLTSGDMTYQNDDATGAFVQVGSFPDYTGPTPCVKGTSGGPLFDGTDTFGASTAGNVSSETIRRYLEAQKGL